MKKTVLEVLREGSKEELFIFLQELFAEAYYFMPELADAFGKCKGSCKYSEKCGKQSADLCMLGGGFRRKVFKEIFEDFLDYPIEDFLNILKIDKFSDL